METLLQLIDFLIVLCNTAGGARILYCFIRMRFNPDEIDSYKKKMINLFIFLIIANSCLVLKTLVEGYFK